MTGQSPVSFVDVRRRFEFRSIEVGRWVTPLNGTGRREGSMRLCAILWLSSRARNI